MDLRFLHYSDVENAYDDPDRIGRLASLLRRLRDDATLVCGTGDTTAPGLLSMETEGSHAHRFFRAVSPDFATFGNHDFDNGCEALREIVANTPQTWVTANLRRESDSRPFGADVGVQRTALASRGGTTVGVVGVTDPETVRPHYATEGLTVAEPRRAVAEAVDHLEDRGADYVVVLSHAGRTDDELARLDGVDLVLGGHVHDIRADSADGTPVVHPGQRAEKLTDVTVTDGDVEVTLHDVSEASVAEDVADAYRELFAELGLDETVTRTEMAFPRGPAECYPESTIGNTVADAYRWAANADIAVFNAMQLRTGPPLTGEVTVGDLRSVNPFDNEIHTARLTGDEVLELLGDLATPGPDLEVFGHVSGATLSWRRSESDLDLASATIAGETPELSADYTVAAPTYAFQQRLFEPLGPDRIADTHGRLHSVLVEYVRRNGLSVESDARMSTTVDTAPESVRSLR